MSRRKVNAYKPLNSGNTKPLDKEERWLNDTTPAYAFIHPDGKEVWI